MIKKYSKLDILRWVILLAIAITDIYFVKNPLLSFIIFLLPVTFAALHSGNYFGWVNTVVMFAIIIIVGFGGEYLGVHTGLVFGNYYYNPSPSINGFLIGGVPPLVTFSYISMGYCCYVMSRIILGAYKKITGWLVLGVAAMAAVFMVIWDMSFDPTSSIVQHLWTWERGGAYFGEPFHNFTGWFMVTFTFFVVLGLYLWWRTKPKNYLTKPSKLFLFEPIFLFAASAVSIVIKEVAPNPTVLQQNLALIALFGMGTVALIATLRLIMTKNFN